MSAKSDNKFLASVNKIWNNKFFSIVWVRLALLAFLLNFVIECLNRLSPIKGIVHVFTNPLVFVFNTLVIFFTLCIVPFFKKRIFVSALISTVWMVFGIVNCIISANRKTPFTAPDFLNIADGLKIIRQYISIFGIVMLCILVVAIVVGIVFLFIKSPSAKDKINPLKSGLGIAVTFGIFMLYFNIGVGTHLFSLRFGNIRQAYRDYGFVYCFTNSLINSGIHKPKDYSKEKVDEIIKNLPSDSTAEAPSGTVEDETTAPAERPDKPKDYPNIIFLQLESFFDPTLIKGMSFSEDPIPVMHSLYKQYSSGYLSVPSFGAGTANTEFEIMSGMNLDDFGPGEYPYKTILRSKACESIGYYLSEYGYKINALHDNDGDFYERNEVFSRLGYDTFTSLEYMNDYENNAIGWAKDKCLIKEILGIMNASGRQDFVYAISVQGHGEYPDNTEGMDLPIQIEEGSVINDDGFEFYVNQLHEMDEFVGELIGELSKRNEHTVLVIFGDHLPSIDVENEQLINGDIYQTQYVIWDNFSLPKQNKNIEAFQLSSVVLDKLGINGGIISKFHLKNMDNENQEDYLSALTLLEYDILYGNCEAYGGEYPYHITNLKMGYKYIFIDTVKNISGHVVVTGQNFTADSKVMINDEIVSTVFNTDKELIVDNYQVKPGDKIIVVQKTVSEKILSSTSIYIYR